MGVGRMGVKGSVGRMEVRGGCEEDGGEGWVRGKVRVRVVWVGWEPNLIKVFSTLFKRDYGKWFYFLWTTK